MALCVWRSPLRTLTMQDTGRTCNGVSRVSQSARKKQRRECRALAASTVIQTRSPFNCTCSVTFGALHAALDPVDRLDARGRIDAFGGEVLDVDQIDPLRVGVIFCAADRDPLERLGALGERHLNETAGRLP